MTEAPDYKTMLERKNAASLFGAYVDVFELMIEMEPKLFKEAVKTLKSQRSFKLDIQTMKRF